MTPADRETFFERFIWGLFGDAAFEDVQGVWDPLWALRGDLKQPGMSEQERQELVVRALRELARAGLIYFFRSPPHTRRGDAADDASLRLSPEELDPVLDGDWWRGPDILPPDHPS